MALVARADIEVPFVGKAEELVEAAAQGMEPGALPPAVGPAYLCIFF
jgi:hypothetical protein